MNYVKVGLWGPKTEAEAIRLLQEVRQAVESFPGIAVIATGYADAQRVGADGLLSPRLLPHIAQAAGVAGCMLDTAIKDGHGLFDFLTSETLQALADEAHAAGLIFALAGALRAQDIPLVQDLGADVVGVRSAACQDGRRTAPLETERVRQLREAMTLQPQRVP